MENERKKPKILIVDDDEEGNRLLRTVFQNSGFEVLSAFDGVEGLDLATKQPPDLIITGIVMPRMSGFEMIQGLQNNVSTAKTPVIVYSHLGREEDRQKALELGVKSFLVRGMATPTEIVEHAKKLMPHGEQFYLEFDPQAHDAKRLAEAFGFPPYFECPNGSRMRILLTLDSEDKEEVEFRAKFVCDTSVSKTSE